MSAACDGCAFNYFACIAKFYNNDEGSLEFLRSHGVLPSLVTCPECGNSCSLSEKQQVWRCTHTTLAPRSKKRRSCDFSVSDYQDTFLGNTSLSPWKVVLFINHWLSKHWDHDTVVKCLKISEKTYHEWHCYCSQVTNLWFENQDRIGGPGLVVEIDKAVIECRQEKGGESTQIWLFGGVERGTDRRFTVPLMVPLWGWTDRITVLPLVIRLVL